jgi:CheY-like chemotaxis protein
MILMDCNMPTMDGWTATREIRLLEQKRRLSTLHARIPIVGLSASPVEKAKPLGLEMGMDDYLTKPVKPKGQMVNIAKWNCALHRLTVQEGGQGVQAGERVLLRELLRQVAADTPELEPCDAQAKEAYAPMAAAVHRLVRSCGTQFCGVDLTSALDDGRGTDPGVAWSRFAQVMIDARDALGTLVPLLQSAYSARDNRALHETVRALRGIFAKCMAKDGCELCSLFESELRSNQTSQLGMLVDALEWQAMDLMGLVQLIGDHHTKLDFENGVRTYGSCVAFQQQLQMFCFNVTGYVSAFPSSNGVGLGWLCCGFHSHTHTHTHAKKIERETERERERERFRVVGGSGIGARCCFPGLVRFTTPAKMALTLGGVGTDGVGVPSHQGARPQVRAARAHHAQGRCRAVKTAQRGGGGAEADGGV